MSTAEMVRHQSIEAGLMASVSRVLSEQPLCPDDLLAAMRKDLPGLTLERLLITLYENTAVFQRRRGRWYVERWSDTSTTVR
jgi:hypothetical protein